MNRTVVLVAACALVLAGCAGGGDQTRPAPVKVTPTTATSMPTTSSSVKVLVPPAPYQSAPAEVEPELKRAAIRAVQTLTTYGPDGSSIQAARSRLAGAGLAPVLADKAGPLFVAGASSAGDIVYPQLGGLRAGRASVMVVVRQRLLGPSGEFTTTRTVDVRLARRGVQWVVEDIGSLGGEPVPEPPVLSPGARRVLSHPRIQLPDSARWDIHAGRVSDRVLNLLAGLADGHDLAVTVFSSGHPLQVFGTSRVSNHIPGRAVDLWSIDGPVSAQRQPSAPLRALTADLLRRGVNELGGPFDVDGGSRASFTDIVHQDHLHLGFDS